MLKIVLSFLFISFLLFSCLKKESGCPYSSNNITAPAAEQDSVLAYLAANSITAIKHSSGLYYQVVTPGSSTTAPGLCSTVMINYTGKLTNGQTFDSNNNVQLLLGTLIEGWKKGIPLIQKGGQIRLFIPPTLGYGSNSIKDNNGVVIIPAQSILVFDVTLNDFTAG